MSQGKRACTKLYENLESVKQHSPFDSEIQAFYDMLRDMRRKNLMPNIFALSLVILFDCSIIKGFCLSTHLLID